MLVKLRNTWYAPDGKLYRVDRKGTVVSDSLKGSLPSSAAIWDEKEGKFVPKEKPKEEAKPVEAKVDETKSTENSPEQKAENKSGDEAKKAEETKTDSTAGSQAKPVEAKK